MVLDSPGGCCETICAFFCLNNYGFGFSRRLLWRHLFILLLWSHLQKNKLNYLWFWILMEVVVKPFAICLFNYLWFWILQEVVVKPFAHCLFKYLLFWILQEAVVKPFAHVFFWNSYGFGFSIKLLWNHLRICFV